VNARWTTMVHTARLTIMVCVLFSAVVSKADAKKIVIVDVDSMPIIQRQADEIDIWQKDTTESIKSWRAVEEEKLTKLHHTLMAAFNEQMRKLRCNEMKTRLTGNVAKTMAAAKKLAGKRRQAADEKEALRKSSEILAKLTEKMGGEERGQLSESDDADFGSKQDARDWLKALETSDPSWQHAERRKMQETKQTDPHWRSKMDNSEGDGGRSWTTHGTTHLDTAPSLTRGNFVGDNLIQLGENLVDQEPLLQASDILALEKLGSKKLDANKLGETVSSPASAKAELYAFEQRSEEKPWLRAKVKAHEQLNVKLAGNIKKMEKESLDSAKAANVKLNVISMCGSRRSMMHKLISDTIIYMPIPEEEKIAPEKTLMDEMEEWLKCELCKAPKAAASSMENKT